ncbi:hypothetical protein DXA95_10265 [Odoribacter sp. OF09-27XD]|nr:hypothetical protein DXA95_10265 [Odoribacter sp. OF09-27XD]
MQISIIWDVYNSKSSLDCKGKLKSEKDDQEAGIFKNKNKSQKKLAGTDSLLFQTSLFMIRLKKSAGHLS